MNKPSLYIQNKKFIQKRARRLVVLTFILSLLYPVIWFINPYIENGWAISLFIYGFIYLMLLIEISHVNKKIPEFKLTFLRERKNDIKESYIYRVWNISVETFVRNTLFVILIPPCIPIIIYKSTDGKKKYTNFCRW